ncbi:MAG: transcriptional regulator [Thermoplasmata archaeon]
MKKEIIERNVREILATAGFYLSQAVRMRRVSIDIIARRDRVLLLIKVLENIDALDKKDGETMKLLSNLLAGTPLIVGDHYGGGKLEHGVVYSRFKIPIISIPTLRDYFLEGIPPYVFSAPGGLYVKIDSKKLKELRELYGYSLGALAESLGVSRKAIQLYEENMSATIDMALSLEEIFNTELIKPIDLTKPETYEVNLSLTEDIQLTDELKRKVLSHLSRMGCEVMNLRNCPFDAITKKREFLFLTWIDRFERIEREIDAIHSIVRATGKKSVIFVKRKKTRERVRGIPVLDTEDLMKVKEEEEILRIIMEGDEE